MNPHLEINNLLLIYGINKIKSPKVKTFILSIFGGLIISLGAFISSVISYGFSDGKARFMMGLVFPTGYITAYCCGAEVITGDFLLIYNLFKPGVIWYQILIHLLIVLVGNFIGALIMSLLIVYSHLPNTFQIFLAKVLMETGIEKCTLKFGESCAKGTLANFFICFSYFSGIWGKYLRGVIFYMWATIFVVGALNLEDCISDLFYIFTGIFTCHEYNLDRTNLTFGRLFYKSLLPILLGDIIGGGFLVGLLYCDSVQVIEEKITNDNVNDTSCDNMDSRGNLERGQIIN